MGTLGVAAPIPVHHSELERLQEVTVGPLSFFINYFPPP